MADIETIPSGISVKTNQRTDIKNPTKFNQQMKSYFDENGRLNVYTPPVEVETIPSGVPVGGTPKNPSFLSGTIETITNIPSSTFQLVKDTIQPILHPIDTYNAMKSMAIGFKELYDRKKLLEQNPNAELEPPTEEMVMAEAVNQYFADRYGDWVGNETDDWSVIGDKVLQTIRKDPAGFMADASIIITGPLGLTKLATKATGTANTALGQFVNKAQQVAQLTDPIYDITKGTGKALKYGAGGLTGKGTDAIDLAFQAGAQSEKSSKSFKQAKSGKTKPTDIANELNTKVGNYKKNIQNEFKTWANSLPDEYVSDLMTPEYLKNVLDDIKFGSNGNKNPLYKLEPYTEMVETSLLDSKGKPILEPKTKYKMIEAGSQKQLDELKILENEINSYIENPSLHNPKSLQQLKTNIGNLKFDNYLFQEAQSKINTSILDDLNRIDPNTGNVMGDYSKMMENLNDIQSLLGKTGDDFRGDLLLGRAKNLIKDTPKSEFGQDKLIPILNQIESELIPSVAGLEFKNWSSPNTGRVGRGILYSGGAVAGDYFMPSFTSILPEIALAGTTATLPMTSPKIVGTLANLGGDITRSPIASLLTPTKTSMINRYGLYPIAGLNAEPFRTPLNDDDLRQIDYSLFGTN